MQPEPGQQNGSRPWPVIVTRRLVKTYILGETSVYALRGVSLKVYPGEFVAIMGPSGSGKSSFMNLIGCLDHPTSGDYFLAGMPVSRLRPDDLADIRNRRIGFVFQSFNLLVRDTALTNVMLPMIYAGFSGKEQERRARRALQLVGLGDRISHLPTQLSGGEQQRVAIARALVNSPSLLLADEPTGNLDSRTSLEIMAALQSLNARGITIIIVTHNPEIAAYTRRQVVMRDGRVVSDEPVAALRSAQADWSAAVKSNSTAGGMQIQEETQ
ncbi:MAG: ABC transporter ATP-binding protein [Chloroflexi bacterium]|nr:MAG: macrolide ABC transporter ATP-binding protein [Ktedonobacter sp. 13_2_20CM_53_11]TMC28644.1 MAG: ABC transporter ATP-binding protein [Chloroflexota bacterium]TMD71198.1 MAG: ABC transporter ATP-binding protein [Chloroflexota bacterium]